MRTQNTGMNIVFTANTTHNRLVASIPIGHAFMHWHETTVDIHTCRACAMYTGPDT